MTPPITSIPPHYPFDSLEEAQAFCDTVNKGEGCTYVEPIMYDGATWGALKDDVTVSYAESKE